MYYVFKITNLQIIIDSNLLRQLWQHSPVILTGFLQGGLGHSTGRHRTSPCYLKHT